MKITKYLILLLFLTGCGISNNQILIGNRIARKLGIHKLYAAQQKIDPQFLPYISEFESHFGKVKFSVVFTRNLSDNDLGMCYINMNGTKRVVISVPFWEATEGDGGVAIRWCILFHELHHCSNEILDHDDRIDEIGHYHSIMYPNFDLYHSEYIYQNKDLYIRRMKNDLK